MDYWWNWKRLARDLKKDGKEFFINLWENIVEIFKHTFIFLPRKIKFFITRMYQLIPLAWDDCDYDWSPILRYLSFKIKKTRDHIAEHQLHTNWKRDVKDMDKTLELIEKCYDDFYYLDDLEKELDEKYGKNIWWSDDNFMNRTRNKKNKHLGTTTFSRREKWTPELDKEIHRAERAKFRKAHRMHQKDWDRLGKMIATKLRGWWD